MGEDGKEVQNPRFPYRLRFHPTGDISFPDEYHQPINDDLLTIPSGSTLYKVDKETHPPTFWFNIIWYNWSYNHTWQVYALDKPADLGGEEEMIAELVLTSNLTTSRWGDTSLFFRHQEYCWVNSNMKICLSILTNEHFHGNIIWGIIIHKFWNYWIDPTLSGTWQRTCGFTLSGTTPRRSLPFWRSLPSEIRLVRDRGRWEPSKETSIFIKNCQ